MDNFQIVLLLFWGLTFLALYRYIRGELFGLILIITLWYTGWFLNSDLNNQQEVVCQGVTEVITSEEVK